MQRKSNLDNKMHLKLLNDFDDRTYERTLKDLTVTDKTPTTKQELLKLQKRRMINDRTLTNFVKENYRRYKGDRNKEISLKGKLSKMYGKSGTKLEDLTQETSY